MIAELTTKQGPPSNAIDTRTTHGNGHGGPHTVPLLPATMAWYLHTKTKFMSPTVILPCGSI